MRVALVEGPHSFLSDRFSDSPAHDHYFFGIDDGMVNCGK